MPRILSISAKCSDMCFTTLEIDGETVVEKDGYVPRELGVGGGDYVEFEIDLDTGKIVDWKVPEQSAIDLFVKGEDDS